MKKTSKRELINMLFSAFLIIGYVVCIYFLNTLLSAVIDATIYNLIDILSLVVFGLLLFYATRVGEGKQVKRFNLPALILIDIPALYIICASLLTFLPLHDMLDKNGFIVIALASVALGYGIPYTFLSGYEISDDEDKVKEENELDDEDEDEDYQYSTLDINEKDEDINETDSEEETEEDDEYALDQDQAEKTTDK